MPHIVSQSTHLGHLFVYTMFIIVSWNVQWGQLFTPEMLDQATYVLQFAHYSSCWLNKCLFRPVCCWQYDHYTCCWFPLYSFRPLVLQYACSQLSFTPRVLIQPASLLTVSWIMSLVASENAHWTHSFVFIMLICCGGVYMWLVAEDFMGLVRNRKICSYVYGLWQMQRYTDMGNSG